MKYVIRRIVCVVGIILFVSGVFFIDSFAEETGKVFVCNQDCTIAWQNKTLAEAAKLTKNTTNYWVELWSDVTTEGVFFGGTGLCLNLNNHTITGNITITNGLQMFGGGKIDGTVYVQNGTVTTASFLVKEWEISGGTVDFEPTEEDLAEGYEAICNGDGTWSVQEKEKPVITGIEIENEPTKKVYSFGEELDITGLVVNVVYSDGTKTILQNSDYQVSGFDTSKIGKQTIQVQYKEYTDIFSVEVWIAHGICGTDLTWTLDDTGELKISGTGIMDSWKHLASSPWYSDRMQIKKIVVETGITSIGDYAFEDCSNLTNIELPESLKSIGNYAFSECSNLTSIELPESLKSIGYYAFSECSNLTSIELPESLKSIGYCAFSECSNLKSIELPAGVESIGESAFYRCSSLSNIELPKSLTSIEPCLFRECTSLTRIEVPVGVKSIGVVAFDGCTNLKSIKLPEGITSIGYEAFCKCSSLTSIELPDGITELESRVFYGCSSLTSVKLPEGIASIESQMFYGCSSLTSIELPKSLTSIGFQAFFDCNNLTKIELPESLNSIGRKAFGNCSNVISIVFNSMEVPAFDDTSFYSMNNLKVIYVPGKAVETYKEAFSKYITDAITILPILEIIKQPENQTAGVGDMAVFEVEALGNELNYQWQYSTSGKYWFNSGMEGSDTAVLSVEALEKRNGQQYRCLITDSEGNTLISDAAVLTINENVSNLIITEQPKDQSAEIGSTASFCVVAEGTDLSYQWQYSKTGVYWYESSMEGSDTSSMKVVVTEKRNNYQYRCLITDSEGNTLTSDVAVLTINKNMPDLIITEQPKDQSAEIGSTASFCVVAEGTGVSYQWQYSKTGVYWYESSMEGSDTSLMKVVVTEKRNNYQYRCVITDSEGNTLISDAAVLTINENRPNLTITEQPKDQSAEIGSTASFCVAAEGTGLSYQWQYSTSGKYWFDSGMEGANTEILEVPVTLKRNGQQYRCVITDESGNKVITDVAMLMIE